jgi:hypothetical protein
MKSDILPQAETIKNVLMFVEAGTLEGMSESATG